MEENELFESDTVPLSIPAYLEGIEELLQRLEEISPNAQSDAIYALLSGLPAGAAVHRFVRKVLDAAECSGGETKAGRAAAEAARNDRLDPDTEQVRNAAGKTAREADRMKGLLRFSRNANGSYTARCAPDHFVLPLLSAHFLARFGDTPWEIIDERRGVTLVRERGAPPVLRPTAAGAAADGGQDGWETLWKTYHATVNNEARTNPALQRQFMPRRYWDYLPEMALLYF